MPKHALIVLVDGFEEIEAVTPIDVLRRAGVTVTVAGLEKKEVASARGLKILADTLLAESRDIPDLVILPGGPGAEALGRSLPLRDYLKKIDAAGTMLAAICAAPATVLGAGGFLEGKRATCFPGYEDRLGRTAVFSSDRVVVDGRVITSRGPGTALEFSLELVRQLVDGSTADSLAGKMLAKV